MNKYKFQTIVATPEIRTQFTELREQLGTSDKQLMTAIWNLIDIQAVTADVERLKGEVAIARAEKKELKAAAKRKEKPVKEKKAAKKAAKKAGSSNKSTKAPKVSVVENDENDDDFQTVVVDGTL
jgi:hypothetical protein